MAGNESSNGDPQPTSSSPQDQGQESSCCGGSCSCGSECECEPTCRCG